MKTFAYFLIVALTLGCSSSITENYKKTLESLEKQRQTELDKGERMMLVEQKYEITMDSILNVVYKDLMLKLNDIDKKNLREEQREWIKKRDTEFEELWKPLNEMTAEIGFIPQDARMIVYSQKASYIKKRVLELIDKLEEK